MANVRLAAIDLAYILKQVKIGTDYTKLFGALDPAGVREVSGANNNLVGAYDQFGNYTPGANPLGNSTTADTPFLQLFHTQTPGETDKGTTYNVVDPNNPMEMGTSVVMDAMPRLITNLISSSVTDPLSPIYNPAAVAAMNTAAEGTGGYEVTVGNSVYPKSGTTTGAFIGDQGVLGGATFNEFFVAFGQFFDHGLDFISKGGGFVAIQLSPSDPLYVPQWLDEAHTVPNPEYVPGASNVMYLNRASLSNPASDFDSNGNLLPGKTPMYNNNTGYLIDQSQTYGSHATVNAFLRQYDDQGRATGFLINGTEDGNVTTFDGTTYTHHDLTDPLNADMAAAAAHNMATWADLKFNALRIGVQLVNSDVNDMPAIRVDNTGKLLFTPNGTIWTTDVPVGWTGLANQDPSDPFVRHEDGTVVRTNQPMFADMNPAADPMAPASDALDIHFVSGDGRTNENIGLTAVHNIFHEEHNLQTRNVMNSVLAEAAAMKAAGSSDAEVAAYVNEWTRNTGTDSDGVTGIDYVDSDGVAHVLNVAGIHIDAANDVAWDGDYLFQAGRLITESEYNHIAINDYVRSLAVLLPEFVSYSTDVHPNVSIEFAQAIFRLGHSMLTEQLKIAVTDVNGKKPGEDGYIETFSTDTDLFDAFLNPALYQELGGSAITLGLLRQQANQIDEFVTPALQQTLVGAPLDLAALNIARGRDVGLPTLNELRQQVYEGLQASGGDNSGAALAPYTSWQDFGAHLRTAESLVNFIAAYGRDDGAHDWGINEARDAYLAGTINPATGEKWSLADIRALAQGILDAYADAGDPLHDDAVAFMEGAPAYNETTGEWNFGAGDQGFWDVDLWLGGLAEMPTFDGPLGTTFSYIMLDFGQRMMDGDRFYYLYRMPVGHHLGDELLSHTFSEMIERTTGLDHVGGAFSNQTGRFLLDGTSSLTNVDSNSNINDFFNASQHKLADGVTPANLGHIIVAGQEGNDYIIGGVGDDYLYGDEGNDTIQGGQGNDNIFGGDGDDWIYDDENDDTINGGKGNDHIFAGPGVLDVIHGAEGDDELHGGTGIDEVYGDDGDDALFGESDTDLMMGGEGNDYMNGGDGVDEMFGGNGNDWMQGNVGDDNINGGSGNDLLEGGQGAVANDGDRLNGDSPVGLGTTIIEWNGDGTEGDMDIGSYEEADIPIVANLQTSNQNGTGSTLMDTYAFLEGLVGSRAGDTLTGADENTNTSNGANNYLVGGGGDDILEGLGGDDFIFGDAMIVDNNLYNQLDSRYGAGHAAFTGTTTQWGEVRTTYADGTKGHILGDSGTAGTNDTVVFSGDFEDYTFELVVYVDEFAVAHNAVRVIDGVAGRDGTDVVVDVESFKFANGVKTFAQVLPPPTASVNDVSVTEGDSGSVNATFTVTLSNPYSQPITITYGTSNGTAAAPGDYTSTSGSVTIPAGSTSATVTVPVLGDTIYEANESFSVNLTGADNGVTFTDATGTGTIMNDDALPTVSISGSSVTEGDAGTKTITFTVTQSVATETATTVHWDTADGTATGGSDFVSASGDVTIAAGDTSATFTVTVNGDTAIEGDEAFSVSLSAPVNATIATGTATGTIVNDDLNIVYAATRQTGSVHPGGATPAIALVTSNPGTNTMAVTGWTNPVGDTATYSMSGTTLNRSAAFDDNQTYTVDLSATTSTGGVETRTVTIKTGSDSGQTLSGVAGSDTVLYGKGGIDLLSGSTGNDWIDGGAGNDVVTMAGSKYNYNWDLTSGLAANLNGFPILTDLVGNQGTDTLVSIEQLVFADGTYGFNNAGNFNSNIVLGNTGNNAMNGGGGNDIIVTGAGNDTITYNVDNLNFSSVNVANSGGRDLVFGGAGTDTFVLNGNGTAEDFYIYSRDAFLAANPGATIGAATGIVITRNGTGTANIIAELNSIEEIKINTAASPNTGTLANGNNYTGPVSGDNIHVVGDFTGTGLAYNTITVDGGSGNDSVDISGLTSAHRVVFNTNGGQDNVVGELRPQDIINGVLGLQPEAATGTPLGGGSPIGGVVPTDPFLDIAGSIGDYLGGMGWQHHWAMERVVQPVQLSQPELFPVAAQTGLGSQTFESIAPVLETYHFDIGTEDTFGMPFSLHRAYRIGGFGPQDDDRILDHSHHLLA